jgi:hypothetical protein
MLPENINRLITKALDQVLLEASRRAAKDSKEVTYDFARRGLLISNVSLGALLEAHIKILEEMSAKTWNEMKRVLDEIHATPYLEIENDLTALLDARLTAIKNILCRSIESNDKTGHHYTQTALSQFDQRYRSIESKYKNEIGIYCAALNVKAADKKANRMSPNVTNIVCGDNSRVLVNSQDNSINVANSQLLFAEIQNVVDSQIDDEKLKRDLLEKIAEMETNVGKGGFIKSYSDFVALAANHMTIIVPFLPALTQLLQAGGAS